MFVQMSFIIQSDNIEDLLFPITLIGQISGINEITIDRMSIFRHISFISSYSLGKFETGKTLSF